MFVCPLSYYIMMNLLESVGEQGLLEGWTDVTSCMRLQEDGNDLKFYSGDNKVLDQIYGQSIQPGKHCSVLENTYLNLRTREVRQCSLREGKFEFVICNAERETGKRDTVVNIHMLGRSNLSLDIAVSMDSKKEVKRYKKHELNYAWK